MQVCLVDITPNMDKVLDAGRRGGWWLASEHHFCHILSSSQHVLGLHHQEANCLIAQQPAELKQEILTTAEDSPDLLMTGRVRKKLSFDNIEFIQRFIFLHFTMLQVTINTPCQETGVYLCQ